MTAGVAEGARAHLVRADGDEDLAFALYRPSSGARRDTAIIDRILLPMEGDRNVHGNASFNAVFFERALAVARESNAGLAFMHSHPAPARGWQRLSRDDFAAESGMAGAVAAGTGRPLVGLTLAAADGAWSARFWERTAPRQYEPFYCESVREVGDALRVTFHDRTRPVPLARDCLLRTLAAWGPDVQAMLARLRIGVVGLGSVGSIVVEALARIGIEHLVLLDFDSLETVNLDRTLNVQEADADGTNAKVTLAARAARASATSAAFQVDALEHSVCEVPGYRAALDCDVLFSCVDRPWARSVLNFIAYAHLIPVIDGGIHVSRTGRGRMRGADWKAHVAGPGRACLRCLRQYDPGLVQAEREGHLDDPSYIESLPDEHPIKRNENVFAFSLAVASLEVLQLLSMVVGPAGLHNYGGQAYHMASGSLDVGRAECQPYCEFPMLLGRGDDAGATGTSVHQRAEAVRAARTALASGV